MAKVKSHVTFKIIAWRLLNNYLSTTRRYLTLNKETQGDILAYFPTFSIIYSYFSNIIIIFARNLHRCWCERIVIKELKRYLWTK